MSQFSMSQKLNSILLGMIGVGVVTIALTFYIDIHRAWALLLVLSFFVLSIGIGGTFFTAIQFVCGCTWSVVIRRVAESMIVTLPIVAVLLSAIFTFGLTDLYEWAHYAHCKHSNTCENFVNDTILDKKGIWFHPIFFIIRVLLCLSLFYFFGQKIKGKSIEQDKTKDVDTTSDLIKWSAAYLPLFAYSVLLIGMDLLMSIEPHWYSTMFSVYLFSGIGFVSISTLIIILYTLQKNNYLNEVSADHYHDLGKYLLGFVLLWAFVAFGQFMLIWYANLPEETIYLERRFGMLNENVANWRNFTYIFWACHFVIPFLLLLSRGIKRSPSKLTILAFFCLFIGFCDIIWMVYGGLQPHHVQGFPLSWSELGAFIGIIGIFAYVYFASFSKNAAMPLGDPNIDKSIKFYQPF